MYYWNFQVIGNGNGKSVLPARLILRLFTGLKQRKGTKMPLNEKRHGRTFSPSKGKKKKTEATFLRELTFTTRSRAQINLRCQLPAVTHAFHHLYRTVELMKSELIPARYRLTMTETTSASKKTRRKTKQHKDSVKRFFLCPPPSVIFLLSHILGRFTWTWTSESGTSGRA